MHEIAQGCVKNKDQDEAVRVPVTITEAAEMTLCPNEEEDAYHKMACLERRCAQCGVHLMELLPEEASNEGVVMWRRLNR